jgi:hypothetical protein
LPNLATGKSKQQEHSGGEEEGRYNLCFDNNYDEVDDNNDDDDDDDNNNNNNSKIYTIAGFGRKRLTTDKMLPKHLNKALDIPTVHFIRPNTPNTGLKIQSNSSKCRTLSAANNIGVRAEVAVNRSNCLQYSEYFQHSAERRLMGLPHKREKYLAVFCWPA